MFFSWAWANGKPDCGDLREDAGCPGAEIQAGLTDPGCYEGLLEARFSEPGFLARKLGGCRMDSTDREIREAVLPVEFGSPAPEDGGVPAAFDGSRDWPVLTDSFPLFSDVLLMVERVGFKGDVLDVKIARVDEDGRIVEILERSNSLLPPLNERPPDERYFARVREAAAEIRVDLELRFGSRTIHSFSQFLASSRFLAEDLDRSYGVSCCDTFRGPFAGYSTNSLRFDSEDKPGFAFNISCSGNYRDCGRFDIDRNVRIKYGDPGPVDLGGGFSITAKWTKLR